MTGLRAIAGALLALAVPCAASAAADAAPSPSPAPTPDTVAVDPRLLGPATPAKSDGSFLVGSGAVVSPAPQKMTRSRALTMIAVPAGCVALGGASWVGLVNQTGDAGTPSLEMGAAYAGAWVATGGLGLAVWTFDPDAFKPASLRGGSRTPWLTAGSATLVPLAAGASTFFAGERLEGGSRHPWESFGGAVGGAALGELLTTGASMLLHTPDAGNVEILAFVPVAAGAAIGYRLGHGHDGRAKPLAHAPLVVVSARF